MSSILKDLLDPYNIPYFLTLGAYVIHEMLGLRLVLAAAHMGFLILAVFDQHAAGILWNILFFSINTWHTSRLLWARRKVRFEPVMEELYQTVFSPLTRSEFRQFWNQGDDEVRTGEVWLAEGTEPLSLGLVVEGLVLVEKGGAELNRLQSGRFFAEMGYLTRHPASATIRSSGAVRCRLWPYAVLELLERDHAEFWSKFQGILGREMAQKIAEQNPR